MMQTHIHAAESHRTSNDMTQAHIRTGRKNWTGEIQRSGEL